MLGLVKPKNNESASILPPAIIAKIVFYKLCYIGKIKNQYNYISFFKKRYIKIAMTDLAKFN
ncbi:hypothetical protein FACS1894152_0300 [Bacilli bacterium]|nr:hypothetical protein FACS1894152_0300 [Bacilli bacterium]